jgi:hypothetical protein
MMPNLKPILISTFLAISCPFITSPALALPQAQIMEKLQNIPVFAITNSKGVFLQESPKSNPNAFFTRVFMSRGDANRFFATFKKSRPQDAKVASVRPINLSTIYQIYVEAKTKKKNMGFVFIPAEPQVRTALKMMKKPYNNDPTAYGVPLFYIAIAQKGKYYTLQRNNLTPLFFEREQAQTWLDSVKQKDPKLAAQAQIKVNSLQSVIENMRTTESSEQKQLVFVPSREAMEVIRQSEAQQGKPVPKP